MREETARGCGTVSGDGAGRGSGRVGALDLGRDQPGSDVLNRAGQADRAERKRVSRWSGRARAGHLVGEDALPVVLFAAALLLLGPGHYGGMGPAEVPHDQVGHGQAERPPHEEDHQGECL